MASTLVAIRRSMLRFRQVSKLRYIRLELFNRPEVNSSAEALLKFQNDVIILTTSISATRFCELLREYILPLSE